MANEKGKDHSELSLPTSLKITVGSGDNTRNVTVFRVPLGRRIKLLKFYSRMMGGVAGGGIAVDEEGAPVVPWETLFKSLPDLLSVVEGEYLLIIKSCTDLDTEWADVNCELADLYKIFKTAFEVNRFGQAFAEINEADNKKKDG